MDWLTTTSRCPGVNHLPSTSLTLGLSFGNCRSRDSHNPPSDARWKRRREEHNAENTPTDPPHYKTCARGPPVEGKIMKNTRLWSMRKQPESARSDEHSAHSANQRHRYRFA